MSTPPQQRAGLRLAFSLFFTCLLFLGFLLVAAVFVEGIVLAVQYAHFPQNGVQTPATVVEVQANCGKHYTERTYTVQFTDQAGHLQTGNLSCEAITLSSGSAITIVYLPANPTVIALPGEAGVVPGAGVIASIIEGLLALGLLVGTIFWVRHEKALLRPLLSRRSRANFAPPGVTDQVGFAQPMAGTSHIDEKRVSTQEFDQPELFEAHSAQEETDAQ